MDPLFDIIQAATRQALSRFEERKLELAARELELTEELLKIEGERKTIEGDKDTLEKAQAIHARLFESSKQTEPDISEPPSAEVPSRTRARIGPQRYAMLATLRRDGPLTVEEIAQRTSLQLHRVKEQMRSDQPHYALREAILGASADRFRLRLTDAGRDLLKRFEEYRTSQGKPLPSLTAGDDGAEDEDEI